jgi:hypothetical protein
MHPLITQAIAAERRREDQARAAAAGRARPLRRSRRVWLLSRLPRAGRVPAMRPAPGQLRGPRAA